MEPRQVAELLHRWAHQNGYLDEQRGEATGTPTLLNSVFRDETERTPPSVDAVVSRLHIVAVFYDKTGNQVTVATHLKIGPRKDKPLPDSLGGVSLNWIGACPLQSNPGPVPLQPPSATRCFVHKKRIACGSSVIAAPLQGAGTLGCLVKTTEDKLCGLSCNHVTGGCNHTEQGMPILAPAPVDASPDVSAPVPRTIGRHLQTITLQSGDPRVVPAQEHDAAIFEIRNSDRVTSYQGNGEYDTPNSVVSQTGGSIVKKIGRTTGLTRGRVLGPTVAPLPVLYEHERFHALVYLTGFGVMGFDQPFAEPGDSGALVVTDDAQGAVGLVAARMGKIAIVLPLAGTLKRLGVTLVSGHNV